MEIEPSEQYLDLQDELMATGKLFKDPDFPAIGRSIGGPIGRDPEIRWLRPPEITINPQFIIKGMTRQDIYQGRIRDCFLLAGTACLATTSPELLYRVVPPDQNFNVDYTETETKGAKNEFWVSLLEKAYAKLNGSYMNIDTGFVNEALVDLTGGLSEIVRVEEYSSKPKVLFKMMSKITEKASFMGCAVNINSGSIDEEVGNGLYSGHAYSVTKLTTINYKDKTVRLIRLRNPWGRREWSGDWGDKSHKWRKVSENVRLMLEYDNKNDGEFWMDFEDWIENFKGLYICHLTPESYFGLLAQNIITSHWTSQIFHGKWILNQSAGGCGNPPHRKLFWTNPQYLVSVQPLGSKDNNISLVISLTQKDRTDETNDYINFLTFQVKPGVSLNRQKNFTQSELALIKRRKDFVNVRDLTAQLRLHPGHYVIVPCTFRPNRPGRFMLRVFSEVSVPPQTVPKVSYSLAV
ncbi:hypothetical protein LSH36_120g02000 [Paralvinella palmiformis]|uniref:Calpain catalytic domain-containing protein n=1 Tax=Paralvinella palmiformis TaxID=53620 RepID=A0AAD9JY42_9ANNE|nr:hypothetical protein LSH36_120g02000 [Paralvinella palmiformis]